MTTTLTKFKALPYLLVPSLLCWPTLSLGQDLEANSQNALLWFAVALLFVKGLIITRLVINQRRKERLSEQMKSEQGDLERRLLERSEKLRSINQQLYEEVAKHEITEELLTETQDYLHSMINSMPSILIGVTGSGHITQWNAAASQATGIEAGDAITKNIADVAERLSIDVSLVRKAIDQGVTQIREGIQHNHDGQASYTDQAIYPLISEDLSGAVIRIDDVTMRVRLENMMIQNEKMMSLGELAAGMAHEINNPLSAILHGVQNIHRRTSPDLPANLTIAEQHQVDLHKMQAYLADRGIYKFVEGIHEAGERAARIVTNMLEFSRSGNRAHAPVNIVDLLDHSLELAANSFQVRTVEGDKTVKIRKNYGLDLPDVHCSAAEIQQVILNVLRNACQAFNMDGPTKILEPEIILTLSVAKRYLTLKISDNGPGMPDTVKRHIFEPFYTTKEVGKGTGLGLSVSYFIITEHHDGQIEVDSTLGQGTTFAITLPLSPVTALPASV